MSREKVEMPYALHRLIVLKALRFACRHGVLVGQMFNPTVKPRRVALARGDLIAWMRRNISTECDCHGKAVRFVFEVEGHTPAPTDNGTACQRRPISYPLIGELMGLNHATIVLSHQRWRRARMNSDV